MHPQRRRKKRPNYGTRIVELSRGSNGFGFTISGQQPCIMSCVVVNSPADNAGLRAGDFLISVNGVNVSKMPHDSVVQLIGSSTGAITMAIAENYFSDSSEDEITSRSAHNLRARPKHLQVGHKAKHKFNKHQHGLSNSAKIPEYISNGNLTKSVHKNHRNDVDKNIPNCSSGFGNIDGKQQAEFNLNQRIELSEGTQKREASHVMHAVPSTSNASQLQQDQNDKIGLAKLVFPIEVGVRSVEYKAVVGYLGTIEMPKQIATSSKLQTVRSCIRKLRQEKRSPTIVLMTVLPTNLSLCNANGNLLADYPAKRINYVSCSSENDYRFFGLVTSATYPVEDCSADLNCIDKVPTQTNTADVEISNSCHVFMIDTKLVQHENHLHKASSFHIKCTIDPVAGVCLEFPNSSEYIVNIIRIMFSLKSPNGYSGRDNVENISKFSNMNYRSPKNAGKNFVRNTRHVPVRCINDIRPRQINDNIHPANPIGHLRADPEGILQNDNNLIANSPQPSNHSEITTTSSNSDSGIGFHNDTQNVSDRIVVVDFSNLQGNNFNVNMQYGANNFNQRSNNAYFSRDRPAGIAGVSPNFEMDDSYLSNTTPVVEGFGGLGRPLNNLDHVLNRNVTDGQNIFSHNLPAKSQNCQPVHENSLMVDNDILHTRIYSKCGDETQEKQRLCCRVTTHTPIVNHNNMPDVCSTIMYSNRPTCSTSKEDFYFEEDPYHQCADSPLYDQVYTENEDHHYEIIKSAGNLSRNVRDHENISRLSKFHKKQSSAEDEYVTINRLSERSVDVSTSEYGDKYRKDSVNTESFEITSFHSSRSQEFPNIDNKQSIDNLSIYSSKSHDAVVLHSNQDICSDGKIQTSMDDILILGMQNNKQLIQKDSGNVFLHPGHVIKSKLRKNLKHTGFLSKTKQILQGRDDKIRDSKSKESKNDLLNYKLSPKVFGVARPSVSVENFDQLNNTSKSIRFFSASVDECIGKMEWNSGHLETTCSEPDLRVNSRGFLAEDDSDHTSPFRRWATGGGAAADRALTHRSYRRPQSLAASSSERDMYTKVEDEAKQAVTASIVTSKGTETGSVAAWSLGLERLLADPKGTHAFCAFLAREFAAENIRFWTACERYARSGGGRQAAEEIWKRHLSDGAPDPVNVDASARNAARERLVEAPPDLFLQAQKQIFNLMKFDSYPRFLRSSVHADCARAELRGIPPPYPGSLELQTEPYRIQNDSPHTPSPSKLKKSLSNAEERRRGSLLPWAKVRLRVASRDRSASNTSSIVSNFVNNNNISSNAESNGNCPQKCSLCRVMLPDAATTVVAVEDTQTIRQLIDKLLEKRAIVCRAYDVFDAGSTKALDTNQIASCLGGREVVVERRVVFRIELPNRRCVSVRCRPTKPLRDVLRPVLQRYGATNSSALNPSAPAAAASAVLYVALAGTNIDLNSPVQIADGQRLQVCLNDELFQSHPAQTGKDIKDKLPQSDSVQNGIRHTGGGPTLDEITNRVFEELLQGKTDAQIIKSDRESIKSDNCQSEHSSSIFGQVMKRDELSRGRNQLSSGVRHFQTAPDGSLVCCLEEGNGVGSRKPLITKLKAGVKVQSAANNHAERELSQTRLKEKFLNGDFGDGKTGAPLQTSCSYESALKRTITPPVPAARNPSNILAKPCPAIRTAIGQTRSSLPHTISVHNYPEPFKGSNVADEDKPPADRKNFFNGSYSLPKSGFNSLENTVIENNMTLCVDHFDNAQLPSFHCNGDEVKDGHSPEGSRKQPRMNDPPPLPPKPKVLPAKPSNWGHTLSEHSLIDSKMQEVSLPTPQMTKKVPYLDQAASSFV